MTWNELKEFCNSLDEKQLKRNVILWREEEAISKIEAERLAEDHYIDEENGEGCFPESESSRPISELKKVYDAGDAILWEEF